ncbi:MAG: class I SAM-dependent methyltransferase [Sedimentisphaerales bacterium]|nr:class I SAM-dependent methyltransferase [Sedimentisphaerales bacterium]MBN2841582.1 class I SAM-dependent methyltransferase [Sedimentisphaerales bacterium]
MSRQTDKSQRLLELGCGSGTLCNYLRACCQEIVAIDLEPTMIEQAQSKYPDLSFYAMDICQIDKLPGKFDFIFSLGNVISYLDNDKFTELIAKVADKLTPGGKWLYQIVNWDYFADMTSYDFPDKKVDGLIFKRHYDFGANNTVAFNLSLQQEDGKVIFDQTDTIYRREQQSHIKLNADYGFTLKGCWSDWQSRTWQPDINGGLILSFTSGNKKL